uniref:VWFA domain-containing protein n=1 Tax=Cyclopterus lumpus TaxID=8103 RepID=A0A8C2WYR7_CYCLU
MGTGEWHVVLKCFEWSVDKSAIYKSIYQNLNVWSFSLAAIPVSLTFNIDTTPQDVYIGEQNDFFGYKVLQFMSGTDKGVVHECNENSYVNGVCYTITNQLQQISSFKTAFQECTKKTVDLVFLFDGSRSMSEDEFNKNKDFIVDIMNSLKNSSIKFAAVQFSTEYRKVFDFNDYQAGRDSDKLQKEPQLRSLTNTHKALKFVDEILDNSESGASPDATKVVVLITDGDPSDSDRNGIIKRYDEKNIIRFVIGVSCDVSLLSIASDPKDKNAFKIENYDRLKEVLENFQKKIFKMEGSKVSRAGDMTNEMSQSGFSAVFYNDTLILGSVGSNSWRGSLQHRHEQKDTQIDDPHMQMDSYMGYSISVGEKNSAPLYFSGAPRFEHIGQVVLFRLNGKNWTAAQRINGDQIGSYFGAELCSVDVNSDGNTDFLLVGAPLFYHPHEKKEGQIYVYTLTDEMQLKHELIVTASSMGRFGSTISSLADLNGDRLRDVAVGAPLENDNTGTVYIYLGDRHRGIRSTFSQRIMGQKIKPVLRFFGQAIDGHIDLGEDGLPDIVVGSQGAAVVLRSRPVFNVNARLSFIPNKISTDNIDCLGNTDETLPMVTLTACFEMVETTKTAMSSGLNISYMLCVDPMRPIFRGFFSQTNKKSRNLTSIYELRDEDTCFNYSVYMPKCVKDTSSPISIRLNFFQVDNESASAVLNMDSKMSQADVEVCTVTSAKCCRTPTLLVAEEQYFQVLVKLSNHGDDSYNTSLTMHYPRGLSFSRMTFKKATRPTIHSCQDLEGVLDKTICGISRPVFRSRSAVSHIAPGKKFQKSRTVTNCLNL